jgi:hypothetical protein
MVRLEVASMKSAFVIASILAVVLVAPTPAAAGLAEAGELAHARANARAGGPLSERDIELLERWGCLSGTDYPLCRRLAGQNDGQSPKHRRKHRRH